MNEPTYYRPQVAELVNRAADDTAAWADLASDAATDLLNLVVNVLVHRLTVDASTSVDDIVTASYSEPDPKDGASTVDTVRSWLEPLQ